MYDKCLLCPNRCAVDRHVRPGACGQRDVVKLAWAGLHRGEEPPITGEHGSGMLFFTGCPLACRYCQNQQISSNDDCAYGIEVSDEELVQLMLSLQDAEAATLNLVTGTHFIPSIAAALDIAKGRGFHLPVVWNSSGYESLEGLTLIDPYVDIYLVDVKTYDRQVARTFCGKERYVDAIDAVMDFIISHKNVTDMDAMRGTIVRHLVFPGALDATKVFLRRFAQYYKDHCWLSLMVQFIPPNEADRIFPPITDDEYDELVDFVDELGIDDGFIQEKSDDDILWVPDFREDVPFPAPFADALPAFLELKRQRLS